MMGKNVREIFLLSKVEMIEFDCLWSGVDGKWTESDIGDGVLCEGCRLVMRGEIKYDGVWWNIMEYTMRRVDYTMRRDRFMKNILCEG